MAEEKGENIYDEFEIEDGVLKNFFEYVCKKAEITVPDGVTTIGEIAFADSNLCKITLPETVKSIEGSAFLSNFICVKSTFPSAVKSAKARLWAVIRLCGSILKILFHSAVPLLTTARL